MTAKPAEIGHNSPPTSFIDTEKRVDEIMVAAEMWAELDALKGADQATKARSFLGQIQAQIKVVETKRKEEKQPHLDAAKAVDDAFKPLLGILAKCKASVSSLLTAWNKREQERLDEERRAKEAAARKAAEEAAEAARKAAEEKHSIQSVMDAEEAEKRAAAAASDAIKASREKVGVVGSYGERRVGLRTTWKVRLTDPGKAFRRYRNDPGVIEALEKAARSDVIHNKAREIPGFEIVAEEIAV